MTLTKIRYAVLFLGATLAFFVCYVLAYLFGITYPKNAVIAAVYAILIAGVGWVYTKPRPVEDESYDGED